MGCSRRWRFDFRGGAGCALGIALAFCAAAGTLERGARAQESYAEGRQRLQGMSDEEKEALQKKKDHFDQLKPDEQQRLRRLHAAIEREPNAGELWGTATLYARWLSNLDPAERSTLLDIKDPPERIARIKEIMKHQEERRFQQYAFLLPEDDLKAIYKWLGEWVLAHYDAIRDRLPRDIRQRMDEAPDEDSRRRAMIDGWQRSMRYGRLPMPSAFDYQSLLGRFSGETQTRIESQIARDLAAEPEAQRTTERQEVLTQQRLEHLVQTALFSRFFPVVPQEELLKFYANMKPDDPRRQRLDGKEGEELRRELQRMYNWERMTARGAGGRSFGPPGGRDGRGGRPDGRHDDSPEDRKPE